MKYLVDLSHHNGSIDFETLKPCIDGAILRAGYGENNIDRRFIEYAQECKRLAIPIGIYWFSYAYTEGMAAKEAKYCADVIRNFDIELPVFFDWESEPGYRVDGLSFQTMNDCAVAFCETVRNAGYQPGVYFSKQQGYYAYDLGRLSDYVFWVTNPGDFPDFYYAGDIWQYSMDNAVSPGIPTPTDLNMMFIEPDYEVGTAEENAD